MPISHTPQSKIGSHEGILIFPNPGPSHLVQRFSVRLNTPVTSLEETGALSKDLKAKVDYQGFELEAAKRP